jgi:hypothetical protein
MDRPSEAPPTETDDRFPSGPWMGYYQQWSLQARQRLALTFLNGAITGSGQDPGGAFDVRGHYDTQTGRCSLVKTYPEHRVEYDGTADGDGIGGDWVIRYGMGIDDRGVFRIWPHSGASGAEEHAEAEQPVAATA